MTRLVDAANTLILACSSLVAQGYKVEQIETQGESTPVETWTATKQAVELVAGDPIRLLGRARL